MAELTYEHVLELFAETNKKFAETNKQIIESEKRYQEQRIESDKRIEKINKELSRKIADLGDTLGRFAEEQVRADLINKFNNWGIPVHAITNHYVQKDLKKEFIYEVDILIYNSKYAIALEVKNTLRAEHIDEHLERLKKIQEYPMVGIQEKHF